MDERSPIEQRIRDMAAPGALKDDAKFQAKLSFDRRCAILALDWCGYSRRLLSKAFGVNRSTIAYVCNPSSPHYRDVRRRFAEMGKEAFIEQYATNDIISFVNAFKGDPELELSRDQIDELRSNNSLLSANKAATKQAGSHRMVGAVFDHGIRFDIVWIGDPHNKAAPNPGWYVVIDDTEAAQYGGEVEGPLWYWNSDPEHNTGLTGQAFRTSGQALDAFLKNDEGKLI